MAAYPTHTAKGKTMTKNRKRRQIKNLNVLLLIKNSPKIGAQMIRMAPTVIRIFRVPIHEIRKNPVANVPRIDPRVEKA
jgi:hypothetical protein